ncbi:GNAT family N-acetyltransferase [Pseudooceanicola sp. CBS1P-1]|uniref:GNAT family N-acetyltransferase n=1 Tax=Pseudooceanicola albus TaxID=2692189 RepID=A0A6L7FZ97_9RHOB|nr:MULTISPECIES: GNAT family N-acetyltransferase [Pseudooceanicola]MBT9382448.1 GNAT family N-acetyltransferase [Pseudooceanicola endophyticus]MXN16989.1 GNAT family N-acetyltransferase [Pseudooceanicola albus]
MTDTNGTIPDPHHRPTDREAALAHEVETLQSALRAIVAVAMQHGLRDYCKDRHPAIVQELEAGLDLSEQCVELKYPRILAALQDIPGLRASCGETGERTYFQNDVDDVAYLEHALKDRRFVLRGIWVVPAYRGQGIAHRLLRKLIEAADETQCGIALYHEPFGTQGLKKTELEAFYNRHGFQQHETTPGGLFRFPGSPLDLYARRPR